MQEARGLLSKNFLPPPLCVVVLVVSSWWVWWWWSPKRFRSCTRSPPSLSSLTPSISQLATSVSEWVARCALGRNSLTNSWKSLAFCDDRSSRRHLPFSSLLHCQLHFWNGRLSNHFPLYSHVLFRFLVCNHRSHQHWVFRLNVEYSRADQCHGFHFQQLFHFHWEAFLKAFHSQLLRVLHHHAKQCWHLRCWKLPLLPLPAVLFVVVVVLSGQISEGSLALSWCCCNKGPSLTDELGSTLLLKR